MKEHLLTLFLAVTTALTIFTFASLNRTDTVPVFDFDDILFEHQTMHGNIVLTSNPYQAFSLSFLSRHPQGDQLVEKAYAHVFDENIAVLSIPSRDELPFTVHAVVSPVGGVHEVIVFETGNAIAHHAFAKKTTCEDTAVFLVASADLTGRDVLILGFDVLGNVIVEIEIP